MRKSMKLARKLLLSGVLIVFPLAVTAWLVATIFRAINGTVTRVVRSLLGWSGITLVEGVWWERLLPLAGLLVSVTLLMGVGMLATNLVGRRVIRSFERLLLAIPLVSVIYSSAKQLLEAFSVGRQQGFREVVALEYPRKGCWALGFVTSATQGTLWKEAGDQEMVQVFLPTSPNPTSGMMLILPADGVRRVDLSVEEAIKMIVSGGLVLPSSLVRRPVGRKDPES
ncbi:MAG: DUF502 domain-containing protein [Acidobacteria bacterium]|nr:MAG: DUF502 domain-containing protein [Acidobacteriota bacterium]